nr:hypothetical protein [uncultured Prevotella sp.]
MNNLVPQLANEKPEKEQEEQSGQTAENHHRKHHPERMVSAEVYLSLPLAEHKEEYCQSEHYPCDTPCGFILCGSLLDDDFSFSIHCVIV